MCLTCITLTTIGWSANYKNPLEIQPDQARDHIGLDVQLKFYVFSTARNTYGNYIELNTQQSWDHPYNVMVRIPPSFQKKMASLGIYNAQAHFSGRKLKVKGVLQMMTYPKEIKVPVIYLTSLDQIEVLRAKEYEYKEEDYESVSVMDFKLKVSPEIKKHVPEKGQKMVDLLKEKLHDVKKVLPQTAYQKISNAKIFINRDAMKLGMCYHANKAYLGKVGIPDYYHQCIEVQNLKSSFDWLQHPQPWAILHELAHKYHFEVIAVNNERVLEAYRTAKEAGIYEKVKHANGREQIAYAMMNEKEYFAECTEAYFGLNDYFPFNREELKAHDPKGFEMVEICWGIKAE
jgi:hypothetical protein